MSERQQNIFTDLAEILQVIIRYIDDPFEILKLLNTNRNSEKNMLITIIHGNF